MNKHPFLLPTLFLAIFSLSAHAAGETTKIAKSNGAKQCEPYRISPATMSKELTAHGIKVLSATCGTDGMMHAAVCGGDAGEINIFEIPAGDLGNAKSLGFKPLADWPDAQEIPCPETNPR
jgi:hypothetical protein